VAFIADQTLAPARQLALQAGENAPKFVEQSETPRAVADLKRIASARILGLTALLGISE